MSTVVSLFDLTGNILKPWAEAGHTCYAYDIQNTKVWTDEGITHIPLDLSIEAPDIEEEVKIAFAFPPCDHLAVSGARWFKGKGLRKLASSIELFASATEVCEELECPYLIENPVSTISSYWRKPDYKFHPYQYTGWVPRDNYTKNTCLWTGGGFKMPDEYRDTTLGPPDDRIHKEGPSADRKNNRSATPLGFAEAVYEANK